MRCIRLEASIEPHPTPCLRLSPRVLSLFFLYSAIFCWRSHSLRQSSLQRRGKPSPDLPQVEPECAARECLLFGRMRALSRVTPSDAGEREGTRPGEGTRRGAPASGEPGRGGRPRENYTSSGKRDATKCISAKELICSKKTQLLIRVLIEQILRINH